MVWWQMKAQKPGGSSDGRARGMVALEQPDDVVERPAGVREVKLLVPSSIMEAGSWAVRAWL